MQRFLRFAIFLVFVIASSFGYAAKLYWVGGSGNFNDPAHWSYESGGKGGAKSPASSDDVYFDENSAQGTSIVSIIGNVEVHDLVFSKYTSKIILSGTQNEKITVGGDFKLNSYTDNEFAGDINLISNEPATNIYFSLATCKSNIYLNGSTVWNLEGNIITDNQSTVYLEKGTLNLNHSGIYAGNFIGSPGTSINADQAIFTIKDKFILPAGLNYNDTRTIIFASLKDPSKYQVSPSITFNSSSRLQDPNSTMGCNATLTSQSNPTCAGSCNGVLTFNIPANCTSNPVYAIWSYGSSPCSPIPTGTLTPGSTYTVNNICGCGTQYSVIFSNDPNIDTVYSAPAPISITDPLPQKVISFFGSKKPTCFGYCDGYVVATLGNNGQQPFTLNWTGPNGISASHSGLNYSGKDTLFNACAGTYSVVITDANGCVTPTTYTTTLTQPTKVTSAITTTNVACNGACTGVITNLPTGGTGAISCTINSNPMPGCSKGSLCAGTYTVISTDANGCKDTAHPVITQPPAITFSKNPATGTLTISCLNTCNGSVGVTGVSGGTGGYTFSWAPAGGSVTNTANSSTYSNLCGSVAGTTYTCTIKDANNCTVTAVFTIKSPPALSHTITATNPKCNTGATGSATVTAGGGAGGPYTFNWSPSGGTQSGASPKSIYSGIGGGTYTVASTDINGCVDTATVTLVPPSPVTGTITTQTNPTCPNLNNGKLCVTAGGGTPGYTYSWTPTGGTANCTPSTLTVTPGGTSVYSVTITDAQGCTAVVTGTLTSPPQATVNSSVTNPLCSGVCNGSATLTPSGGVGPFSYQWSCSGGTTSSVSGQCGGTTCNYTVTDGSNCKYTGSVSFVAPPAIVFTKTPASGTTNISCRSICSGTVGVTGVSGGSGSYTYSWAPAGGTVSSTANSSTYSNLCVGTYTCTIKDGNNCSVSATFTVTAPPALSHTIAATNPKCSVGSTGSATVTESGGVAPYTFNWSPPGGIPGGVSPVSTYSNLGPGTYSVNITDGNGCKDSTTITLTPPTAITATFTTISNPLCFGQLTGKLCVTAGGGTPAYTYSWTPSAGTSSCTPSTLGAGTYSVTVTDANSCTVTISTTLTTPPQISPNSSVTNPSCTGLCNASATLSPTGGSGSGYTYQWSCSGGTTNTISGQCGGTTCNYTVTDGTGCKQNGSVSFVSPPTLSVSLSTTTLSCSGNCNAQITSTVTGGSPTYGYAWVGTGANPVVQGVPNQVNMCAGNYTLTATDQNGCTKTATVTITAPSPLSITLTPTNPSCPGMCDGSILAGVSGGTSPYTTSWNPAQNPPGTPNPTNLCAGTYTYNVTDANGCTKSDTVSLITPLPVTATINITNITCSGLCNGSATVAASGGTGPYQYNWDNAGFNNSTTVSGLCVGNHTVIVKDSKGCLATTIFYSITQPSVLTASASNFTLTCNGMCNGGATGSAGGGTQPYQYSWDGGSYSSNNTINNLCVGNHTLTVRDTNGCTATATFSISPLVNIVISSSSTSVSCHNLCDGSATATAAGGAVPYTIQWVNANTCVNVVSCTGVNLCPGTQTVIATDANGCSQTSTLTIANPPVLSASTSTVAAQCFGVCTGASTVTPSGGTAPYSVVWSTGANGNSVNNLCSGNYTATVIDNDGCRDTVPVVIGTSAQFTVTPTITPPSTCGASDGSISLNIQGGVPGYTVTWNTGSTANPLTGLPAGTYTATINDVNGCDTTVVFGVSNVTGPAMSITSQTNASCNGTCDGAATVTATGTAPITISWPGGPSGASPQSKSNLCAGTYVVQAVDGVGCVSTLNVVITEPSQIQDNATISSPSCNGGNGTVTVTPTGGSGSGYTYHWSDGSTSNPHSIPGNTPDTLVITDGAGCTGTFIYNLTPPQTLTISVIANPTLCSYQNNGSASALVQGGTPAASYTWTNSSGTVIASGTLVSNVSNLPPGVYTVSVSDVGGCSTQTTFTINAAPAIVPNFSKTNITCNGMCNASATVAPTGGTGTYTYTWPNVPGNPTTPNVGSLCQGSYQVIVTDGNSCKDTTSFTFTDPAQLTATVSITNPTCAGLCNGSATVTTSGGTGTTYTVSWSPNVCVNCPVATNLCAGQYTVTSIDSNGCTLPQIVTFTTNPALNANVSDTLPTCVGDCDGIIYSATVGGTGTYSYQWIPAVAGNVPTANNLCSGTYTLIVTDGNNCKDTSVTNLPNPLPLSISSSAAAASCGQNNGSITISSVNGNGAVTVNWINPTTCGSSLSCDSLGAGIYSVQLTDSKGCKDTFQIAVTNSNGPNVTIADTNVTCNGSCNGTASVTAVSGVNVVTPYTYSWTPPNVSTQGISSLCAGQYISVVTDSVGCKTLTTILITEPPVIQDAPVIVNATCFGLNDGSITSNGSGGTPGTTGYQYSINGGPFTSSNSFPNLGPGSYTICIKDSLGCTQCFPYTVGANTQILSSVTSTNINCASSCNGSATLGNINGGTAPYSIVWNDPNSQAGPIASNLCAGSYTATITDNAGCKALDTVTIIAPSPINPNAVTSDPACGQCNGSITLAPTGGTPGIATAYTYTWNTGANTSAISGVCAGVYQVDITDSLGCKQSIQFPVSNNGAPSVTLTVTNPTCSNPCSGAINTTVSGGVAPYTYSWPLGGQITPSINNQCSNTYFVQVKDSMGCISTDSASIVSIGSFTVTTSMVNPPCNANTGSITANVNGGTGSFIYSWSNGATTATNGPIAAGIYTLVVTDSGTGCTDTLHVGLNSNANGPILQVSVTDALCNGMCNGTATVSAFNGVGPYSYTWSPGGQITPSISNQCPGTYEVQVQDMNGCVTITQATITEPNPLIASLAISSDPLCNGDCNGAINIVVSGGTPVFTYSWNPSGISGTSGSNLCAGNYSVAVTDVNGCAISVFDTLVNPPKLSVTGTVTPASCNTTSDAAIHTSTSGGTPALSVPGYTYQWSGGSTATTDSLVNIPVGNYTVVATDSKNCTDTAAFVVNSNVTVLVNAGNDTSLCASSSFVLNGVVNGAVSIQWVQLPNPPGPVIGTTATVTITPPSGATTQYVLTGANGACVSSDTISITSNPLPVADAGPNISIFNGQSGSIGGSPTNLGNGTIVWQPAAGLSDTSATNPVASPTITTTYSVFVTNSSGCVGMDTVTVVVLPTFVIPNGFSPNSDGYNDVWMIDNIYKFPNCEVEVYNRWGEQLFYSKGYGTPWNGTYQGKPVPVGTYYYVIRLNDPEKKFPDHYTGPITILR